jgi:uncharacterized protein YbjT (DUF2867 family)
VDDVGAFVALAFAQPHRYVGTTLEIAGDELRPPEIASALSTATGRDIHYAQIPIEAVRAQSEDFADAVDFLNRNGGYGVDITRARALRPTLIGFEAWLGAQGRTKLAHLFELATSSP